RRADRRDRGCTARAARPRARRRAAQAGHLAGRRLPRGRARAARRHRARGDPRPARGHAPGPRDRPGGGVLRRSLAALVGLEDGSARDPGSRRAGRAGRRRGGGRGRQGQEARQEEGQEDRGQVGEQGDPGSPASDGRAPGRAVAGPPARAPARPRGAPRPPLADARHRSAHPTDAGHPAVSDQPGPQPQRPPELRAAAVEPERMRLFGRTASARAELTLGAALRDLDHDRPDIRGVAVRNLAPALLDELGLRPPAWWTRIDHPQRDQAAEALDRACDDPAPQNAALARIGLAQLSAPQAHARAREALAHAGDDDAAMFMRECGVIALSLLGGAARALLDEPDAATDAETPGQASVMRGQFLAELVAIPGDPRGDLRFQPGPAPGVVGGTASEPAAGWSRYSTIRATTSASSSARRWSRSVARRSSPSCSPPSTASDTRSCARTCSPRSRSSIRRARLPATRSRRCWPKTRPRA